MKGGNVILNWSKIDNDITFQRLVNHLFALECDSPGFIPSSPYIGADGGFDGYYPGFYNREGKDGVWSIQSKWTTQSGKDAVYYLTQQIKEELQKAKGKSVDHLRIATNAELKVEQVLKLEGLNKGEVATLKIWHREELTRRIELQPFLRHYFFGLPTYPKFVPWNLYFNEVERHLLPDSAIEIAKFKEYISKITEFLRSDTISILLIHSFGGYGKSHLLRETAQQQIAHQVDSERQTWMIRTGYRKMEDAIQDEIMGDRRYLLIFDDADRFPDEIKPFLSFIKHNRDSVKTILALRTSGLQTIYNILTELRIEELYDEIKISDWFKDDLIRLLRMVTGQEKIEDEEIITTFYPNPFLIVWIGKQIKKEPTLDLKKVKEIFAKDVDRETERCLKDVFKTSDIEDFLVDLTCLTPFSRDDTNILRILGAKFKIEIDTIKELIDNLEKIGILRVVGNSIRFNPDMKGDLYLAYKLEKTTGSNELEGLVNTWLPVATEKLFINLESAARYANIPNLKGVLSKIVDSWIRTADSTQVFGRKARLNLVEKIAHLIPENCLNLLFTYLELETPSPNNHFLKSLGLGETSLTTDDYGPVVLKLIRIPPLRKQIVELIYAIDTKSIEGTYDNYKPASLIKNSVSPLYNNPNLIIDTLDIFPEWLDKIDDSKAKLISAALSEVLAGSHKYTRSTMVKMIIEERVLKESPEICKMRDKALYILESMIAHKMLKAKLAGIHTAERIGMMFRASEKDLPLSSRISKERARIVEKIGQLVSPKTDFQLLNEIENLFLKWWAQLTPGTDKVEEYLQKVPRSLEYIVFRLFVPNVYVIENFNLLKKQAPTKDRWNWFVHTYAYKTYHLKPKDFQTLAEALNTKYGTENQAVEFLRDLEGEISRYIVHPPIITCWVNMNPTLFSSIRRNNNLWKYIPQRFKNEIELAIAGQNKEFLDQLAGEVLSELPNTPISKVKTFIGSLIRCSINQDALYSWLSVLLEKGDSKTKATVVYYLSAMLEKINDSNLIINLLLLAISKETKLTNEMVNNLSLVIHNLRHNIDSLDKKLVEDFRKELYQKLKEVPELDYTAQSLLDFAFYDIDETIDFIEFRLYKSKMIWEKEITDQRYEAIPHEGIDCIAHKIKSFDDYEKLMTKITTWYEKNVEWRLPLESLMSPIKILLNNSSGKLYLEEYIEKQLKANNFKNVIVASIFLPFNESTIPLFIEVAEKGISSGKSKDIEALLHSKIYPDAGFSSKLGESPPELVARKDLFLKMYEKTKPGMLSAFIKNCVKEIDSLINQNLKQDEELINSRI